MASTFAHDIDFYTYAITSPFGFLGQICSLITFSSKSLRITSTGFLFIVLTLSDASYLLISIYDFLEDLDLPMLTSEHICRLVTFIQNFSTVASAWFLVLIAMDRLVRVRFPFRQARLCTRKVAAYMTTLVCICATLFTHHVLGPEFGFSNRRRNRCGLPRSPVTTYSNFYFNIWPILQLLFTYVLPGILMILCLIGVYYKIRRRRTIFVASVRRERQQRQMLVLMISSVSWFLICTLPYGTFRMVTQRIESTPSIRLISDILQIFRNMNYCFNFYIYCLTSHLFRKAFVQQIQQFTMCCKKQLGYNDATIHPLPTILKPRVLTTTM